MSEFELVQLLEASTAQIVFLLGQIIAISFAMIVAIYYFLNRAPMMLKATAFLVYSIGALMFLLLAVRESNVIVAASAALDDLGADNLGRVAVAILEFSDSWISTVLNFAINISFWALWAGIFFLLFIWKRKDADASGDG